MRALRLAIAFVFVTTSCLAQDVARMEEVVQTYVKNQTFMGTVLVARGGEVILNKGYGSANLEWDVPNTPATKFRLGSITKQFTAASILLLEERGKLTLDDPIKKYLPDAPDGVGHDHDLQPADAHLGDPEFHEPAGLQIAEAGRTRRSPRRSRPCATSRSISPRRENELQQLRLSRARTRDRDGQRPAATRSS